MKIIFYGQDGDISRMIAPLKGDVHWCTNSDEVLAHLEDVDEDDSCLLFLDYDHDLKEMEKFNKSLCENEWIIRLIISGKMKVKEFKKHQKGKTAASGYILKPFTMTTFKAILNDLEISNLIEENEAYEEGQELPSFPTEPSALQGFEQNVAGSDDSEDFEEDGSPFEPNEFKMNTEVRNLVDMHSVKGDGPPYEGDLNSRIQVKFDSVFDRDEFDFEEGPEDTDFEIPNSSRDDNKNGLSLNLDADEDESDNISLEFGDDGDDNDEIDLNEIENDELDISSDEGEIGGFDTDLDSEIDFDEEVAQEATDTGDGELEELSFDEEDDILDGGELDFSGGSEIEEAPTSSTPPPEELMKELDEMTANRQLPTKAELSEFEEDTGDLNIPEDLSDQESPSKRKEASSSELELSDEIDLEDDDDFVLSEDNSENKIIEEEIDASHGGSDDGATLEAEGSSMSDELEDDGLEFDDNDEGVGELAFSTPEEAASQDGDNLATDDEGALDFSLDDDAILETGSESISAGESKESRSGGFSLGEDDEELDLGDDSILEAIDDGADAGKEEINTKKEGTDLNSEFDNEELSFSDEEDDEEIEKTMAVNLDDMKAAAEGDGVEMEEASLDDDEDLLAADESSFNDNLDLDGDFEEDESANDVSQVEDDLDMSLGDEDISAGDEFDIGEDSTVGFDDDNLDIGDETNPTMVMTEEITRDIESMADEEISTREFRPGSNEEDDGDIDLTVTGIDTEFPEDNIPDVEELGDDTALFDDDGLGETDEQEDVQIIDESGQAKEINPKTVAPVNEGELKITREEDRIPPSFNEGEAIRLQATIRQLREERNDLLKEITSLKRDNKLTEQDNLGLKAELDEAKIEISIIKKRHGNEIDEMKYRLRLADEKKLYAEEKARKLQKEFDRLQQKVRIDFNHVKHREKELESQLELVKMDSESQVSSRDKKILDLKRKIDQLEFNMENIVIREQKSKDDKGKLEDRLERIMKTLRGSIEVLEDDIDFGKGKD